MKYVNLPYNRLPKNGNRVKYDIEGKEYTVEEAAAYYYMKNGYNVIFSENTYMNYLIALLFWDVIFAKIPEAVSSYVKGNEWIDENSPEFKKAFRFVELNGMPSDFYTPNFYKNRKKMIENKLKYLKSTDLVDVISKSYNKYYGKACRLLYPKTLGKSVEYDWDKYSLYELGVVPTLIPKDILLSILLRMIIDIADNRGFPDLICYNDKKIFFVEVKSENDKLSDYQVDWIEYLESLGLSVELCFINHSEKKIKNAMKKFDRFRKTISISFEKSRSKNFEKVISYLENEPTFEREICDKKEIYSISWRLCRDVSKINKLLEMIGTWKSLKIKIDGEEVDKKTIKPILTCINNKKNNYNARYYCKYDYEGEIPFGCRKVKRINPYKWRDFGYINTENGDWIINKEGVLKFVSEMEKGVKYCPYFNINKFKKLIEKIPNKINPAYDKGWAYIVEGWEFWFKKDNKWWSWGNCEDNPPEFVKVIGVIKLSNAEINKTINRYNKYNEDTHNYYTVETDSPKFTPKNRPSRKSGCFIATAVYQNYNAPEVIILRKFRDIYLMKSLWGRLFVRIYYIISPPIAKWLKNHTIISKAFKKILDCVVKSIKNKLDS